MAALWDPLDGDIDPSGVTYAYAKSARVHGAQYFTHTPVIETNQRPDSTWDVVTGRGTIHAEMIVNCGGLWAREVGRLSGVDLATVTKIKPKCTDHQWVPGHPFEVRGKV